MIDKIEKINNTLIQHGKKSNRIYIMKIDQEEDVQRLIRDADHLANANRYTKIFAKVEEKLEEDFSNKGYIVEAEVPSFYVGDLKCFFMAKYFDEQRSVDQYDNIIKEVLDVSKSKSVSVIKDLESDFEIRECNKKDIKNICSLYSEVFETYPFPIFDPKYIESTMNDNVIYFGAWENNRLVAISSIELDREANNAEMTDFATHPDYRGNNLSFYLLEKMELKLNALKVPTAYTIARSMSFGMNTTFSKSNYIYAGTLINNTNIGGQIESMNIWYKDVRVL